MRRREHWRVGMRMGEEKKSDPVSLSGESWEMIGKNNHRLPRIEDLGPSGMIRWHQAHVICACLALALYSFLMIRCTSRDEVTKTMITPYFAKYHSLCTCRICCLNIFRYLNVLSLGTLRETILKAPTAAGVTWRRSLTAYLKTPIYTITTRCERTFTALVLIRRKDKEKGSRHCSYHQPERKHIVLKSGWMSIMFSSYVAVN